MQYRLPRVFTGLQLPDNLSEDVYLAEFSESPLSTKQRLQGIKELRQPLRPDPGLPHRPPSPGSPTGCYRTEVTPCHCPTQNPPLPSHQTWDQILIHSRGPETPENTSALFPLMGEGRGCGSLYVSGFPCGKRIHTYLLDLAHSFFQFFTKTGTTCSDVSSLFRDQRSVLSRG